MQRFPTLDDCPVCGDPDRHPGSLGVTWWWDDERREAFGVFQAESGHSGYAGRVHGGLLSSLLDECMAWACAVERGSYCVTGDLRVRFKGPAPLAEPLEIRARVSGATWGRYLQAEGDVRTAAGAVVATAAASFAALPRDEALRMRDALRFLPGDLDVLVARRES
jgi:acyl-coenzyme A thioesterase PaaI-like protein